MQFVEGFLLAGSVLLPGMSRKAAVNTAECIRLKTKTEGIEASDDTAVYLTVSIGITDTADSRKDFDAIMKEADTAMYEAKKCSRDCTVVYAEAAAETAEPQVRRLELDQASIPPGKEN